MTGWLSINWLGSRTLLGLAELGFGSLAIGGSHGIMRALCFHDNLLREPVSMLSGMVIVCSHLFSESVKTCSQLRRNLPSQHMAVVKQTLTHTQCLQVFLILLVSASCKKR